MKIHKEKTKEFKRKQIEIALDSRTNILCCGKNFCAVWDKIIETLLLMKKNSQKK
jgi:hypothetical protein